jgi:hypothetical protein
MDFSERPMDRLSPSDPVSKEVPLLPLEIGGGRVSFPPRLPAALPAAPGTPPLLERAELRLPPARFYADAQLDDTQNLPRRALRWNPPLLFSLRARASIRDPRGTFGFGFWNDPFSLSLGMGGAARKLPAAPQCAWFFYGSPPHDLQLADGVEGWGWKAQTLSFRRIPSLLLPPAAAGGALLAAFPPARRWAFRQAARFYRAGERRLAVDPSAWHAYAIEWTASAVRFFVDGAETLHSDFAPRPPLGLVLWIDNQYAVASARKGFGFGILPLDRGQALELEDIRVGKPHPA